MSSDNVISYCDGDNILRLIFENNNIKITLVRPGTNEIITRIYDSRQCESLETITMKTIFGTIIKNSLKEKKVTINENKIIFYSRNDESNGHLKLYNININLSDESTTIILDRICHDFTYSGSERKFTFDYYVRNKELENENEKLKTENKKLKTENENITKKTSESLTQQSNNESEVEIDGDTIIVDLKENVVDDKKALQEENKKLRDILSEQLIILNSSKH